MTPSLRSLPRDQASINRYSSAEPLFGGKANLRDNRKATQQKSSTKRNPKKTLQGSRRVQEADRLVGYDPDVFSRLSRFHAAKEFLEHQEKNIGKLGDVICAYGLERRIGVNLLHKHFDLTADEILVRDFKNNSALIAPVLHGNSDVSAIPYLWQLACGQHGSGFYPLEFGRYSAEHYKAALEDFDTLSNETAFLAEISGLIRKLKISEVFGLATLYSRRLVDCKAGETLLERTDEERRLLTLKPFKESRLRSLESTQTLWVFTPLGQLV
jgi:hypothetical protein